GWGRGRAQPCMRGISHEDFQGGTMRKFGSLAAVVAAVLVVALAAWTRQPAGNAQGGATVTGKVKFTGAKPTNPPIDMTEEPKCKAKYTTTPTKETVVVNPNGTLANVFGWMQAYLGVLPHPVYAITGADGSFTIKGLPPGTYTIEAWHEKYGTQTATVTVAGTESKTQDFTFAAK